MEPGLVQGLCTLGGLMVVNIVVVAFGAGRVTQQVKDLCRRVKRLEYAINGKGGDNEPE